MSTPAPNTHDLTMADEQKADDVAKPTTPFPMMCHRCAKSYGPSSGNWSKRLLERASYNSRRLQKRIDGCAICQWHDETQLYNGHVTCLSCTLHITFEAKLTKVLKQLQQMGHMTTCEKDASCKICHGMNAHNDEYHLHKKIRDPEQVYIPAAETSTEESLGADTETGNSVVPEQNTTPTTNADTGNNEMDWVVIE